MTGPQNPVTQAKEIAPIRSYLGERNYSIVIEPPQAHGLSAPHTGSAEELVEKIKAFVKSLPNQTHPLADYGLDPREPTETGTPPDRSAALFMATHK